MVQLYFVFSACNTTMILRKEIRDMSTKEWQDFVNAFKTLRNNGRLKVYVDWHIQAFQTFHWNAYFMPFHRTYLYEFEKELVNAGAPFLPFWDWTWESQDVLASPVLSQKYFGQSDGEFVSNGPFRRNFYQTTVGGPIIREYSINSTIVFYAQELVDETIMVPEFSDFSRRCEVGPHASIHILIGGVNGHLAKPTSPEDPLFWCHHAFIDKLWVKHQTTFGYKYEGNSFNSVNTLNDTVGYSPWTTKVSDVLYSSDLCVEYLEPNPQNMGITISLDGNIKSPDIDKEWLANNGANTTFVNTLDDETKNNVKKNINSASTQAVAVYHCITMIITWWFI
jgi:tyrosinase